MQYDYSVVFPPREDGSYIVRPVIDVKLTGPTGERHVKAVIDSGADISIANSEYAGKLGIEKGRGIEIFGVNRQPMGGFVGEMTVEVERLRGTFSAPFVFVDNPSEHIILGQQGFFDLHRIMFARYKRVFEVTRVHRKK